MTDKLAREIIGAVEWIRRGPNAATADVEASLEAVKALLEADDPDRDNQSKQVSDWNRRADELSAELNTVTCERNDARDEMQKLRAEIERIDAMGYSSVQVYEQANDKLEKECDKLKAEVGISTKTYMHNLQEAVITRAINGRLKEAIGYYGQHRIGCTHNVVTKDPCDCGLDTVLRPVDLNRCTKPTGDEKEEYLRCLYLNESLPIEGNDD